MAKQTKTKTKKHKKNTTTQQKNEMPFWTRTKMNYIIAL